MIRDCWMGFAIMLCSYKGSTTCSPQTSSENWTLTSDNSEMPDVFFLTKWCFNNPTWFCSIVRIGNQSPKWQWLKDKEGKSPWRPQVKQTALLASPVHMGQAQGEEKNIQKEEPKLSWGFLFSSQPALTPPGCIFLCLPINWAITLVHTSLQIFAVARQNWGNYQHPRQFQSQRKAMPKNAQITT